MKKQGNGWRHIVTFDLSAWSGNNYKKERYGKGLCFESKRFENFQALCIVHPQGHEKDIEQ